MKKYSLGIDFGTLSARAVLIDVSSGDEVASASMNYPHAVISGNFKGSPLPESYALQHPKDYLDALTFTVKKCIADSGIDPELICGIGVDFTAATIIPTDDDGVPLCFKDRWQDHPHAYAKLWKHHGAESEAKEITAILAEHDPKRAARYGGIISSEWLLPKVLETLRQDRDVFNSTKRFTEAGDWIVFMLTGKESHSACAAGFKGLWSQSDGFVDDKILTLIDPGLSGIVGTKISKNIATPESVAGYLTEDMADTLGLTAGTPVANSLIDAHGAFPALGVTRSGDMLLIIGTSSCHILLSDEGNPVPGISGYAKDAIYDGVYCYEAGQTAVGDTFAWFTDGFISDEYKEKAKAKGLGIHGYLEELARLLPPGAGGVMAVDWWNGNRTPYVDGSLSGSLIGLTLHTTPEQIYRALIEATAFGTRRIIDIYETHGIKVDTIYAAGGISAKNPLLMEIYSDVTGKEIRVTERDEACAYGSAVLGATAGKAFASLKEASETLMSKNQKIYAPNPDLKSKYDKLYNQYCKISDYLAKESDLMKTLSEFRKH